MKRWLDKARGNPGGLYIGVIDILMVAVIIFFMLLWGLGKLQQWPFFKDESAIFVIVVIIVFADMLRMVKLAPSEHVDFLKERFNDNIMMTRIWYITALVMAALGLAYLSLNWTVLGVVVAAVCGFPQRLYVQLCLRETEKRVKLKEGEAK